MKNKAVIFMMSMVLAMGSAVPAHADTEISENKDLAENGQGVSEYANGWVTGDNDILTLDAPRLCLWDGLRA